MVLAIGCRQGVECSYANGQVLVEQFGQKRLIDDGAQEADASTNAAYCVEIGGRRVVVSCVVFHSLELLHSLAVLPLWL